MKILNVGDKKRSAYVIYEWFLRKTTRIRTPKRFYDDPDAPKTPEDKKDMDFTIETKTAKIKTPKSTAKKNSKIVNSDSEVDLPSTPKMKGTPKLGTPKVVTPKVATPKMGTPTRSSRSSRNCTPKQQGFYDDHVDTLLPSTPKMKGTPKMGTQKVATPKMGTPTRSSRSSRNCTPKQQGFYDDHADTLAPKTPEGDEDFKVEKYLISASSSTSKNKKTTINNITPQKTPKSVSKRSSKKIESSHAAAPPTPKTPRSIAKKSLVFSKKENDSKEDDLNSKRLPKTPKRPRSSIEPVANRLESVFQRTFF